ncbi:transcriptional regulator EutR [Urbifossiella limnaea]|uniref:Transcriptional regulator EutR n=2 Tax=Urbifossiella limnaea TaxID=2528023 RepID=A0A517XPJ0_9BACT|nr:transcriptional regulator EutR [Urbifossiella limnaea]
MMRANFGVPLGEVAIAAELGVSTRTLRLTFRERFGLGPMAYYQSLRLNAVRTALGDSPGAGVGAVARRFGFCQLGQFAGRYRRLFGELPSVTLQSGGPNTPSMGRINPRDRPSTSE